MDRYALLCLPSAFQHRVWEIRPWCCVFGGHFFSDVFVVFHDVHSLFLQESEPPTMQGAVAERVGPGVVSGLRSLWEGVGWGGLAP